MTKRRIVKTAFVVGLVGLLLLPALVYTQVTGRVLNPRLRTSYPSLSAAVAAAGPNDTLLVSGTLSGANAILDSTDALSDGLKIVAGRGLRGTLNVSTCPASGVILDVSGRLGALTIMGLKLVVPDLCIGVYSDGAISGGSPLTVRNLLIQRATTTASIDGVSLDEEFDGPFLIEGNTIPSAGGSGFAIWVDGDDVNPITATVRGNRVGSAGQPTSEGIWVTDAPAGSGVLVERNIVDGGNNAGSTIGIDVFFSNTVTVQRNTVRNFNAGIGIFILESTDVTVSRNAITNNETGVEVFDGVGVETADTVAINFNNIASTVTGAIGVKFFPDSAASVPLDATQNWWGAASGPSDFDGDANACPEASGSTCGTLQPAAPDGTGLPVDVNVAVPPPGGPGNPDCGTTAGLVTTCPFQGSPVSPAGA